MNEELVEHGHKWTIIHETFSNVAENSKLNPIYIWMNQRRDVMTNMIPTISLSTGTTGLVSAYFNYKLNNSYY